MGSSPSKTRTFSVENDEPTNVIKVSDDVVDRIRGSQVNQGTACYRITYLEPQHVCEDF